MKLKQWISLLLTLCLFASLCACGNKTATGENDAAGQQTDAETANSETLTKLTFALDWYPNTNHTGLFVAKEKGYFADAGLDVTIAYMGDTFTQFVAAGQAQFGMDAQDTLAAAFTSDEPLGVSAIAAVLQHNTSGIISRKGDGIDSPKGLAGKRYSTWDNPIELAMLQSLVEADGESWEYVQQIPNNIEDEPAALEANQTDAIWIFYGWGGINAKLRNFDFDFFYFKDLNPTFDYYTPVITGNNQFMEENPEVTKAFLAAVKKGYEFAAENPEEAAQILLDSDEDGTLDPQLVMESQKYLSTEYIADAESWGVIDPARWDAFYKWLSDSGVAAKELPAGTGFTNEYLG